MKLMHVSRLWPITIFSIQLGLADDTYEGGLLPTPTHSNRGFHIGDTCQDGCSSVIGNSFCNSTTNTCQCLDSHPINIDGVTCVQPKNLYEACTYNQQCSSRNEQAFCQELPSKQTQCSCRKGYHAEKAPEIPIRYECIEAETTVPAIVGLFIGLTILLFLFCFMFKLFTQSRWARARAYADAGRPPPTITLEDEQIDLEKQVLYRRQSSASRASGASPNIQVVRSSPSPTAANSDRGEGHISSNYSSRRGSGNNNSEKSLSYPTQSRRGSTRSSLGSDSSKRRTSLQRNGAINLASDLQLASYNDEDCDVEQHITIIPNPRAKRRGSMADHAFPELHGSRAGKKEPENLLILTRTTTDRHGRRHSVAVPLIPPPDGEKFEGGYHVERNPLTGGAKLVPPPGGKHVRARSISEKRGGRERPSSHGKTSGKGQMQPAKQKELLSIPGGHSSARDKRRHSYQAGVPGLTKDMDRLKVSPATTAGSGSSRGVSPRGSTKRRPSVRRSSRSGFLHFLDLAIAN